MDVETAFLYGDIKEEIFMKSPVGMEEIDPGSSPEDCYQLKKGIYGLCQAARQFWKKFVDTIKKESFGFQVSPADPCMLFKENELGICIIIMYVDDMLIIRKKEQIQDFASKTQKQFSVKIQQNLADYLGCEFHMNKDRTRGWLGQPSIIKSLEQKFGERAMKDNYSQKVRKPRGQSESRRPQDLQEWSRNSSLPDKTQQTGHLQSSQRTVQNNGCTCTSTPKRNVLGD